MVPSLLDSLLKDYGRPVHREIEVSPLSMPDRLDFEEIFDPAPRPAEHQIEMAAPQPAVPVEEDAEEDFSLLDLSDEELDLLIDKTAFTANETGPAIQMRAETGDVDFIIPESLSSAAPRGFETEDGTQPERSPGEFERASGPDDFVREPEGGRDQLPPDLDFAEVPVISASEFEAFIRPGDPLKAEDDFVIELSEDDLDSLLVELSHPPKSGAGAENNR
jgi:hypothetical protein